MCTKFSLDNLKGRDHLEDLGIDGRIVSEWISMRIQVGSKLWTYSCGSGYGPVAGSCVHSNETLHSIKSREYFD
jgi:hypothetical protein